MSTTSKKRRAAEREAAKELAEMFSVPKAVAPDPAIGNSSNGTVMVDSDDDGPTTDADNG